MSNCDIVFSPIKFLNATVLSFNTTLGIGSAESTLNVDLIEDCEASPPDSFSPADGTVEVGAPVYFTTAQNGTGYSFGGILTNWTINQGSSGLTYNAKVSDPRQLLENTLVIVDSYVGSPIQSVNYFNVYAGYERDVLDGACNNFGASGSTERGMPYVKIIDKLTQMNPTIYSPTGYEFTIDFTTFPQNVPQYYSVPGPGISLLQLLQDVCDVLGFEFYVDLLPGAIISIGLIDLKNPPSSFSTLITAYNGIATELSYGQELRNEKTKALIFGEKQHYLSYINKFNYFFGEDINNNQFQPVVPISHDDSGFWINKKIDKLNATLFKPFASNGPYSISELDIRTAMSSFELWSTRALDPQSKGSFNAAIRNNYVECNRGVSDALKNIFNNGNFDPVNRYKKIAEAYQNPSSGGAEASKPKPLMDLEAIHQFVQNLGTTYYGKQWICPLNQVVCWHQGENFQEKIFSDVPTNDGGWVNGDIPILGLSEPELSQFRSDDNRINCFAVFDVDGVDETATSGGTIGEASPGFLFPYLS